MTTRRTRWWLALVALLAVAAAGVWRWRTATPAVQFVLLDSSHVELASLRGHPVLIDFWSTTCPPCVREIPKLAAFYREWHPRGVELIAVAMPYDPPWSVAAFQQRLHISYPIALDFDGKVTHAFGDINLIPTAVLIGPDGRERWRGTGPLDFARLRASMRAMLETPESQ